MDIRSIFLAAMVVFGSFAPTLQAVRPVVPLAAKPVVFIDVHAMLEIEGKQYLVKPRNSLHEWENLYNEEQEITKSNTAEYEPLTQLRLQYRDLCLERLIDGDTYQKKMDELNAISANITEKYSEKITLIYQQKANVMAKISAVSESIAKRLGACTIIPISAGQINFWVDPAYDITDEVTETLNKEYDSR
jgi:Skp family chaperone for outer membrane proteins